MLMTVDCGVIKWDNFRQLRTQFSSSLPFPAPTVTSISPTSGPTAGGTAVTITGTNFTGATGVTIGGVAATSVVVVNSTSITAVTPAGSAGTASVLVTTPGGKNAANTLYTYVTPPIWNPSDKDSTVNLSAGNTVASFTSGTTGGGVRNDTSHASGKYYAEFTVTTTGTLGLGIANSSASLANSSIFETNAWTYASSGNYYANGIFSASYTNWTTGDIIGIALDATAGKFWIAKNNTWQNSGDPAAGTNPVTTGLSDTFYLWGSGFTPGVVTLAATNTYATPSGFSGW